MPENSTNIIGSIVSIFTSKEIIIAAIGGAIGTLFAPWTKWKFEKEKIKLENRKVKIQQWKDDILKNRDDFDSFIKTSTFQELKGNLSTKELESFLDTGISYDNFGRVHIHADVGHVKKVDKLGKFLEIVTNIEKEWGII